jgi:chromosome segregation ATPase
LEKLEGEYSKLQSQHDRHVGAKKTLEEQARKYESDLRNYKNADEDYRKKLIELTVSSILLCFLIITTLFFADN